MTSPDAGLPKRSRFTLAPRMGLSLKARGTLNSAIVGSGAFELAPSALPALLPFLLDRTSRDPWSRGRPSCCCSAFSTVPPLKPKPLTHLMFNGEDWRPVVLPPRTPTGAPVHLRCCPEKSAGLRPKRRNPRPGHQDTGPLEFGLSERLAPPDHIPCLLAEQAPCDSVAGCRPMVRAPDAGLLGGDDFSRHPWVMKCDFRASPVGSVRSA